MLKLNALIINYWTIQCSWFSITDDVTELFFKFVFYFTDIPTNSAFSPRILGGTEAKDGEIPWQVIIVRANIMFFRVHLGTSRMLYQIWSWELLRSLSGIPLGMTGLSY